MKVPSNLQTSGAVWRHLVVVKCITLYTCASCRRLGTYIQILCIASGFRESQLELWFVLEQCTFHSCLHFSLSESIIERSCYIIRLFYLSVLGVCLSPNFRNLVIQNYTYCQVKSLYCTHILCRNPRENYTRIDLLRATVLTRMMQRGHLFTSHR